MSHSTPPQDPSQDRSTQSVSASAESISTTEGRQPTPPTPLRCFTGALIAGGLGFAMYNLTTSIAQTFASKPLPSGNYLATNIAVAVRTLVTGMSALGTGIFGIAALGLTALGIQLLVQQLRQPSA